MIRRLVLILAVTLLGAGWLVQPALAAEASGPSTPAAPSTCSGVPLVLSAPATLSPAPLPAITQLMICGCGLPVCMNKLAGASCGSGMKCIANGHCDLSPPTYFCDCG